MMRVGDHMLWKGEKKMRENFILFSLLWRRTYSIFFYNSLCNLKKTWLSGFNFYYRQIVSVFYIL